MLRMRLSSEFQKDPSGALKQTERSRESWEPLDTDTDKETTQTREPKLTNEPSVRQANSHTQTAQTRTLHT